MRLSAAVAAAIAAMTPVTEAGSAGLRLHLLHTNDTESKLLYPSSSQQGYGGAARFKTKVDQLRAHATASGAAVIMVSSGDNFLAGPEWNASLTLPAGSTFYDTIALQAIGYDAVCLGNHDFDFGPEVLARFVSGFTDGTPFLSSNLGFAEEQSLQNLVELNRIAKRSTVVRDGVTIGLVGATTPDLPFISSPGDTTVGSDVLGAIQGEVNVLLAQGVRHIVVMTHLQGISVERSLAQQLRGVDIIVAGGGDELLWNAGQLLVPDDAIDANGDGIPDIRYGPYPLIELDADGRPLPIVTTRGDYRYVGRLMVQFDAEGDITSVDPLSGPVRVAGTTQPDGVAEDAFVKSNVTDPVAASVAGLAANVIATSQVPLDGRTSVIRSVETNEGNLCSDSLLWNARLLAPGEGLPLPQIAFQNAGGIRNNSILPAGSFTELNTFQFLPFSNFVAVIPALPVPTLKSLLENAVSRNSPPAGFPTSGNGRFAQVAGFSFSYTVNRNPGSRIVDVVLDDGTVLVEDGVVLDPARTVCAATIDFLCRGGDEYPLNGLAFRSLGVSYQQALYNFVRAKGGLAGLISSAEYPAGGEGRIVRYSPTVANPSDINGDGAVNGTDLGFILADWGTGSGRSDLSRDGLVDGADISLVLVRWG